MKRHTLYGSETIRLAKNFMGEDSFLQVADEIALTHHEKWDGTGTPTGSGRTGSRSRGASWRWRTPTTPSSARGCTNPRSPRGGGPHPPREAGFAL